jgi:rod shape-determining protein MreC
MLDIRRRTLSLLLLVSFGHVMLISAQVQSTSGAPVAEAAAFTVFARVQGATASVAEAARSVWSRYIALQGVVAANDRLRGQVHALEGQVQQQQMILATAHDLEDALRLQRSLVAPTMAARVIAGDASPIPLTITIDRGSADGITADMAVIARLGVIGRVIGHPTAHASHVQLLVGRSAAAGVTLERIGAAGVVVGGSGEPALHIEFVSTTYDVHPGDRVVTSGLDGVFPRGFLVGWVERADRGGGEYTITVRPAEDVQHLDVVLVVLVRPAKPDWGGV